MYENMDSRPTLEYQLRINAMSKDELIEALCDKRWSFQRFDLFLHSYCHFLWSIIHWNWFCLECGKDHFPLPCTETKAKNAKRKSLKRRARFLLNG